jgi:hypothetical protein
MTPFKDTEMVVLERERALAERSYSDHHCHHSNPVPVLVIPLVTATTYTVTSTIMIITCVKISFCWRRRSASWSSA